MKVEEKKVFCVGDKEFKSEEEANAYVEFETKRKKIEAILTRFADGLDDTSKDESYGTDRDSFEEYIESLSNHLTEEL